MQIGARIVLVLVAITLGACATSYDEKVVLGGSLGTLSSGISGLTGGLPATQNRASADLEQQVGAKKLSDALLVSFKRSNAQNFSTNADVSAPSMAGTLASQTTGTKAIPQPTASDFTFVEREPGVLVSNWVPISGKETGMLIWAKRWETQVRFLVTVKHAFAQPGVWSRLTLETEVQERPNDLHEWSMGSPDLAQSTTLSMTQAINDVIGQLTKAPAGRK